MFEEYEYKLASRRRGVWLTATLILLLLGIVLQTSSPRLIWAIYVLAIVMLSWMMMGVPIAGIRVTDTDLVASAWREPVHIPLDEIAEMRAENWTEESDVHVRLRDGTEHVLRSGDLPPISVLTDVMMERGVYLRDPV